MKRFMRVLSQILVLTLCIGVFANAAVMAAAYTEGEMGEPVFLYSAMEPAVQQNCADSYRHSSGGTVYYYGYNRSPEAWADGLFTSGYTYMQKGGGGNSYDNNFLQLEFDTSAVFGSDYTIKDHDVIYLSFYYKSASGFDFDGEAYTGTDNAAISVKLGGNNQKGVSMFNLHTPDANAGNNRATASLYTQADDSWHKVELGIMVDSDALTDNQKNNILLTGRARFSIDFYSLANAYQIQFAGFSIGLMQFDSTATAEEDITPVRGLEYLCRTLESATADVQAFATDGFITYTAQDPETEEKIYDYTVTALSETPEVQATNSETASFRSVLETQCQAAADGALDVAVYAPAYDKTAAADDTAAYITFSDLDSTTAPGAAGVGCTARTLSAANGAYTESYTLHVQNEYRIFDPVTVTHNLTDTGARNETVVFPAYEREPEPLADGLFDEAYSIELLIKEGASSTSVDGNYLDFRFTTDGYAEAYDILLYAFYVKVESASGLTGTVTPKFTVIGSANGADERVSIHGGTNSHLSLIDDYQRNFAPGDWQKVILQVSASSSADQWLRMGIAADGTTDYKISIAEPKLAIVKLPSTTMPPVEKTNNSVRKRIGSDYATKSDITGVSAGGSVTAVASGDTEAEVTGSAADLSVVSPYGSMPYSVTAETDGTFVLKAKGLAYNPLLEDTVNQTHFNRTVTQYTYSDGATAAAFDYEKHLLTPVTAVTTNYNSKTVSNGSLYRRLNVTVVPDTSIKLTFLKDGEDAVGNLVSAAGGSAYTIAVQGAPFADGNNLILAAFDRTGKLISASCAPFSGGAGTVTLLGIVNTDNSVKFKVFIWDMEHNNLIPITKSIEIDENTIELPEIL